MNAVIYYSNTGQSRAIAQYLSGKLSFLLLTLSEAENRVFDRAVLVFPVYCQNIPEKVKSFITALNAEWLAVAAVYGRMSYGNVLCDVQKLYNGKIAAGAYIPTKHTYLSQECFDDFSSLDRFADRILAPEKKIIFPKTFKNPLADIFPALRSRLGVRIIRKDTCTECGICTETCGEKAMINGVPDSKCIRCLGCVSACPNKALDFSCTLPMRLYLKKRKVNKTVLYL